jgi:hypothetical protein
MPIPASGNRIWWFSFFFLRQMTQQCRVKCWPPKLGHGSQKIKKQGIFAQVTGHAPWCGRAEADSRKSREKKQR